MLSLLVSAVVRVTQDFWQYSDEPVPSASYVFPVPAHAAMCGFEMRSQDGKVIKAVAKEREQARKEHEAAIQEGQMTGLVQHATDDGDHSFRQRGSFVAHCHFSVSHFLGCFAGQTTAYYCHYSMSYFSTPPHLSR